MWVYMFLSNHIGGSNYWHLLPPLLLTLQCPPPSVLGQPSDSRCVAALGFGLPSCSLFGFVGSESSSWHLYSGKLDQYTFQAKCINGESTANYLAYWLCFSGCLVVSRNWHLVVLASLGVCASLRKHLAFCHFPSSCTRLPSVSFHQFRNPTFISFCFWYLKLRELCSEQRVSGPRRNRGHGAIHKLHRRSCWFHWPLVAWRKSHLSESFFTGMCPPTMTNITCWWLFTCQ